MCMKGADISREFYDNRNEAESVTDQKVLRQSSYGYLARQAAMDRTVLWDGATPVQLLD